MHPDTSRRQFLKAASLGAAALHVTASSYAKIPGANDRISIGLIGCGKRGYEAHMNGVHPHTGAQNCEFIAVCDPWKQHLEMAAARVKERYNRDAQRFSSYRGLLALKEVDAVMIASCDHQHTTHLQAAAETGKDVYCEKPLAMDFDRLKKAVDAVKAAKIVCQIGTQIRSLPTSFGCRELYRKGVLGKVSRIEQCRNAKQPYWYGRLEEVRKEDVDWKEFLMHLPMRPFRADLFSGWYGYRDFSDGPIPGLGSHFVDLLHFIAGARIPASCTAQGGTYTFKDEHNFTCPDQVEATWSYPEGFLVNYSTNFGNQGNNYIHFCGTKGTLSLSPWTAPTISNDGASEESELGQETPVEGIDKPDHFLDWLQCLRSRGECNAPIEAGYSHAVAVIMAMRAFDTGRRQVYDERKRMIQDG